ncbi:MAG: coenzyme F420-0:L-glutamate ligase [Peptoniphilaceae bacterium]|nr:coenzyme F420-0:L-glutamate ligase [Peptoniphilaceae bacterium]MDD7383665.1 coenzyme F420-0:L-glutamate ligase [Peptoniphilaceae bacterium]MDY3737836.1 coenzyme F420-0:L-glutamate ligase [Peptoniphilaceae bacterium]
MQRYIGTRSIGIRTPIVKEGDDLVKIVSESIKNAVETHNLELHDRDVITVTESLVARTQGNYATIDQIAKDINNKFDSDTIAILFPILSRNRFSVLLRAFAKSGKKLIICLSYPQDEVGNSLMDEEVLYDSGINPYTDVLDLEGYRKLVGSSYKHEFTGVDYVEFYQQIAPNSEVYFFNDARKVLDYTDEILVSSIHTRNKYKRQLKDAGAKVVLGLDEILNSSVDGSGFNPDYGLLGTNLSTEGKVKLFPRDGQKFVDALQEKLISMFNKNIEVMIYGDGAFKDPIGKIWELADPVVSPAYTKGLVGTPNEIKIKYVADNELGNLSSEELQEKMKEKIREKDDDLKGQDDTLGTTPRALTDLLGSLSDLTSGSGDKGTPVILIQGYFDNYSDN